MHPTLMQSEPQIPGITVFFTRVFKTSKLVCQIDPDMDNI